MTRVLIVGAGGHGHVVADALICSRREGSDLEAVGFVDDDPSLEGATIMGLPVLGSTARLGRVDHDAVFVAIGDNVSRAQLFGRLVAAGERVVTIVHPRAVVAATARVGSGVLVCAGAVVNAAAVLGDNAIVNTGATVDHHCILGAHSHIAPGAHLGGGVEVGEGSLLGIASAVVPGRRVGRWCVVGAGAVVTRDLPDRVTAVGAPARIVRRHPSDQKHQARS